MKLDIPIKPSFMTSDHSANIRLISNVDFYHLNAYWLISTLSSTYLILSFPLSHMRGERGIDNDRLSYSV